MEALKMPLPRLRFTVRRMMAAVAVVASLLAAEREPLLWEDAPPPPKCRSRISFSNGKQECPTDPSHPLADESGRRGTPAFVQARAQAKGVTTAFPGGSCTTPELRVNEG